MEDLEEVLKSLKSNQSRDANDLVNELFQIENIGNDLKESILLLCNQIKTEIHLPSSLRDAFISSIPKNQKNPLQLENQRGIFLVNKVKSILVKLIYNSTIAEIEENLTESNIGSRKERSPRDHVFVINSIINETVKDKSKEPVDFVFYDVRQCFDSLWVEKTLLDLSKNGINNDLLNLIHETT